MKGKFFELFWNIFTEHAGLQVVIYGVVIMLLTLLPPVLGDVEIKDGFVFSLLLVFGMKLLSLISSLFKAWVILFACGKGHDGSLQTYREWTGNNYH